KKRFSKNWLLQASYTYARTLGNYPGTYSPYNDQRDPNISSMFDLPDLLHNREGPLPQDIPHQLKLDGYYTFHLGGDNSLVTGASLRVLSGSPRNTLGAPPVYGVSESFLLPVGSAGRNDLFSDVDFQIAYVRQLPRNMKLQLFFAIYNLFNEQTAT